MLSPKFNASLLHQRDDLIALRVPGSELGSWMSRRFRLPDAWAALVIRAEGDPVIAQAGGNCEGSDEGEVLFVRTTPVTVHVTETSVRSSDGHEFTGLAAVSIRVLAEPAELNAFRRTILGSGVEVTLADVIKHLAGSLRGLLVTFVAQRTADSLLGPLDATEIRGMIEQGLGGACLAGGLAIDGTVSLRFESPSYMQHRRTATHLEQYRERAETRARIQSVLTSAQRDHLTQMVQLFERLRDAQAADQNVPMIELLKAFPLEQRSAMYAALWRSGAQPSSPEQLAVVSQQEVLFFEAESFSRPVRRIKLPDSLGPLRCVRAAADGGEIGNLLVGAATGVHVVDLASGQILQSLRCVPGKKEVLRGGMNAIALAGTRVYATHSELGLLTWDLNQPGAPARRMQGNLTSTADAVRGAQTAEGYVWFTTDNRLWAQPLAVEGDAIPVEYTGSDATISALTVRGGAAYAGNVHGGILTWPVGEPGEPRALRGPCGEPVESIDLLETGGVERLVIADRGPALSAIVLGDSCVCGYQAGIQRIRRAAVTSDALFGLNDTRDRLLMWRPGEPEQPAASVVVPHLTGGRVQDICIVPA